MSAPLPLGLRNPYRHAKIDGRCLDSPDFKVCEACRWEAGARAVIARLRAETPMRDRSMLARLADRLEHELKGET